MKRAALGVLLAAGLSAGCEDFLVAPPQGALDELTLANAAGVEAALIAAYRRVGGDAWNSAPSNWAYGSITTDDAVKGSEATDQPDANDLELYSWSNPGAHNYLNGKWTALYDGISRTNATLNLLTRVQADAPGEISDAVANGIKGEALFLRAHYHFEAYKLWKNIPYYTETDTDFRKTNTGADALSLILADLDQAISLLGDTPRNGQVGRASAWTAKAYKGRVQVLTGDYNGGLATLRDVRQNGPYALEAKFNEVYTGYAALQNGRETILAFQASSNDGDAGGANANVGERLNYPHSGSPMGCCGFFQPTQNLVNFFKVDANGLPIALSQGALGPLNAHDAWNGDDAEFEAGSAAAVDPRLDWTIGRDGVPYKDWGVHTSEWVRDIGRSGPYNGKKHVMEQGSNSRQTVGGPWSPLSSVNIHIFRYADLLLLLAEAEVQVGDMEAARTIVNEIRTRAAAAVQGPGTSDSDMAVDIDDPAVTWANYQVGLYTTPWTDKAYAMAAVKAERRLELAMEGHRLFDLQRWGEYQSVLNNFADVEATRLPYKSQSFEVTERHLLFPIPNRQIDLSKVAGEDRLIQNPGW